MWAEQAPCRAPLDALTTDRSDQAVFLHSNLSRGRVASVSKLNVQWASSALAEMNWPVIPVTSESLLTRSSIHFFSGSSAWRGDSASDVLEGSAVWDRLMWEVCRGLRHRGESFGNSVLLLGEDLARLLIDLNDVAFLYETEWDVLVCTVFVDDETALIGFDELWVGSTR